MLYDANDDHLITREVRLRAYSMLRMTFLVSVTDFGHTVSNSRISSSENYSGL
jgi:hypothetical protein